MRIFIRGAGDIASGIALRLHRSGMEVIMTDLPAPTAIRRTVCFSQAILYGTCQVEGITARLADPETVPQVLASGSIAVLIDPECRSRTILKPDVLVDAILAKRNLGTTIHHAPIVIGVGPGFTAGIDCHAVVETMRGHYLGRVIRSGSAIANTAIPGLIGGYAGERVLRAPRAGTFHRGLPIGTPVQPGDAAGYVDDVPVICTIGGILRGILPDQTPVFAGMKSGDVDPRCEPDHCRCASDKALAVGGGVLEAILWKTGVLKHGTEYQVD